LLAGVVPLVLLGLAVATIVERGLAGRLRQLNHVIARIMEGHLDERLPVGGVWKELNELSFDVNRALDRTQQLVMEAKSAGVSIAHQLTAPLQRVRLRLGQIRSSLSSSIQMQDALAASIQDLDRTLRTITILLRLRGLQSGARRRDLTPVDLTSVADELAEIYRPIAELAGLSLDVVSQRRPEIFGDRHLLVEALAHLVDNAIKFTPAPGRITIQTGHDDSGVFISVSDSGPGLPITVRTKLGRRDGDSSVAAGEKLGLAVVMAVVRLHNLDIVVPQVNGCTISLVQAQPHRPLP
jgi:signal transduction histidine kinase